MEKKYILTDETKIVDGHTLHRIKAVKNFIGVYRDQFGGWIEKEENLSHEGACWVYDEAMVFDRTLIRQDASVFGKSKIYGCSFIKDSAIVCDSHVFGQACVAGHSYINQSSIFDNACVKDNAHVQRGAKVYGSAFIKGESSIHDEAEISGFVAVDAKENIGRGANITSVDQILSIGPLGSRLDHMTFVKNLNGDILVFCGCFSGTIEEFELRVRYIHVGTKFEKQYMNTILYAKTHFSS